jgi:hypothetical protein
MARRRKYYIPITRSGSSILASLITQWINQPSSAPKKIYYPEHKNVKAGCLIPLSIAFVVFVLILIFSK